MAALGTALALGGWAVSIIQQSGITLGVLGRAPFCFTRVGWLALESACGHVAATCTCPVGHRLYGWVNGSGYGQNPSGQNPSSKLRGEDKIPVVN